MYIPRSLETQLVLIYSLSQITGSMTKVFHQEMLNFILKPQYRPVVEMWDELEINMPSNVIVETSLTSDVLVFKKEKCVYNKVCELVLHFFFMLTLLIA